MGKRYDQLDLDDRIEISRLHAAGRSRREIGHLMGRNASTISRELRRNSLPRGEYKPASADRIALSRRRRLSKIERLSRLRDHVCDHLAMGWSPEQIAGRLRLEGSEHEISHESIYRFIYRPKVHKEKLHRFLARAKATRGRRYFKRRREPIAEVDVLHCAGGRVEAAEGLLMLSRVPYATVCRRRHVVGMGAAGHGVVLHRRLRHGLGRGGERNEQRDGDECGWHDDSPEEGGARPAAIISP